MYPRAGAVSFGCEIEGDARDQKPRVPFVAKSGKRAEEKEDLRLCQDREKTFEGCSFINVLLRPPKNSSMPFFRG
jgi:hypothetical protein